MKHTAYEIYDTYNADLLNEHSPRRETVTEIQDREQGELLCYSNPIHASRIVDCVNSCSILPSPSEHIPALIAALRDLLETVECAAGLSEYDCRDLLHSERQSFEKYTALLETLNPSTQP